jgi:GAF domain-containing protein
MTITITTIIPLIAFFLYAALFIVAAISKSPTQKQERGEFRLYLFTMLIWSLSAFLLLLESFGNPTLWFRIMIFAAVGTSFTLMRFVRAVLGFQWKWMIWTNLYVFISMILSLFTNLVIRTASVENGIINYEFGSLIALIAGPGYLLNFFSLYQLLRAYRNSDDMVHKNRLRYLIAGLGLVIIVSAVNFTPLGKYPIDIAGNTIAASIIATAILKHQLLDIKVIVRKSLLYSIPTILISAGYFLIISLALSVFHLYSGIEIFGLSLIVAILTGLVAQPFRDRAQEWIDRLFFREKYDSSLMLQRLSSNVATVLDLDEIQKLILDDITQTLHLKSAGFLIKKGTGEGFILSAYTGLDLYVKIRFQENHPVILYLNNNNKILSKKDLEMKPYFRALWAQERSDLARIDAELFIPLKVKNELVGVFLIGQRQSEAPYSLDEMMTLRTLANQIAVAIENARLYTVEQDRREELSKLYNMSRQLVASDDTEGMMQTIVKFATESINVTYSRILTKDEAGLFNCRAAFPAREINTIAKANEIQFLTSQPFFKIPFERGNPIVVENSDPFIDEDIRKVLFLDFATSVCLYPLRVVDESVGLLILSEERKSTREPFDANKLQLISLVADQAASAIRRASLHEQLEANYMQTVIALANAVDARDKYTVDHSIRMEKYVEKISLKFGFSEEQIQTMRWSARLHDIGKIGVPDGILSKPAALDPNEWVEMRKHPLIGYNILAPIKKMSEVGPIILSHHEKYDGTGYPNGLKGEEIPLGARILTVVDSYIAMTDNRIYRKSRPPSEAIQEIINCSGKQFDPMVVEIFINLLEDNAV